MMDAARIRRLVVFVIVLATLWSLALLVAVAFWSRDGLLQHVAAIGWPLAAATIACFAVNHVLRFIRWQLMLRAEGYRVPVLRSFSIFMAGLALLPTPAKAGVVARSALLLAEGVPVHVSLAAYFAERLMDFIGLVILASLLLASALPAQRGWIFAGVAVGSVVFIAGVPWLAPIARRLQAGRTNAVGRAIDWLLRFLADAADMINGWRLPAFVAIGMLANVVTGLLLWYVVGGAIDPSQAVGVLAVSHLSGSISMLPGGIGGFELGMLAQLSAAGVPHGDALTALALIRLVTLWGSVLVGLPLLWMGIGRASRAGAA